MEHTRLLELLHIAEKLKDTTRHCFTSGNRHESVAEHCWRAALMAYFMKDEFPDADIPKIILMCLVHDLGECFTGDIPTFQKTKADEEKEEELLNKWLSSLPQPYTKELMDLFAEMNERKTLEAKIFKAIDGLEAVLQHNESHVSTWLPNEYQLNLTYAFDKVAFSEYLSALRQAIRTETLAKIEEAK